MAARIAPDLVLTSNSYCQWLHKRQVKMLADYDYCGRGSHVPVVIFFLRNLKNTVGGSKKHKINLMWPYFRTVWRIFGALHILRLRWLVCTALMGPNLAKTVVCSCIFGTISLLHMHPLVIVHTLYHPLGLNTYRARTLFMKNMVATW